MTVRKGEVWGSTGPAPDGLVFAGSDAELFALVNGARDRGEPIPAIGLHGGDLWRTVGGIDDPDRFQGDVAALPVDIVRVDIGTRVAWSAAHVIARRWRGWRGPVVAVMNGQYVGRNDVAPRAHPGDGVLDVVEVDASMGLRERWQARGRLPLGTHVPHRSIAIRRVRTATIDLGTTLPVAVDGQRIGSSRRLVIDVEPDALVVYV